MLARLILTDFRNHASLELQPGPGFVCLHGQNGAGKTNILEAVSMLAPGRGLRGAALSEMARGDGQGGWSVSAQLSPFALSEVEGQAYEGASTSLSTNELGLTTVGTGTLPTAPERRIVRVNTAAASVNSLAEWLAILWLTPAMDRLFTGPASDRRRFLDRLVAAFDPEHGSRILVFEKVMRERNLLLEDHRADAAWLSSLEAHMAEAAVAIAAARLMAVEAVQSYIQTARNESAFPWSEVRLDGEIEALVSAMPAVRAEDEYRRMLNDSRRQDRAAGRTLRGPHRSDLGVLHGPKAMPAGLCSTGEQKALLIGLILAQARAVTGASNMAPVLLLDEVAAHLDRERRRGLFEALAALGCQAWMTGTDVELFEGLPRNAAVFHVEDGTVSEVKRT